MGGFPYGLGFLLVSISWAMSETTTTAFTKPECHSADRVTNNYQMTVNTHHIHKNVSQSVSIVT